MYLPSPAFGAAIVLRAAVVWLGVRVATLFLGAPPTFGVHSPIVLFLTIVLVDHDRVVLREAVILGNAGVAVRTVRNLSLVVGAIGEVGLHLAFR